MRNCFKEAIEWDGFSFVDVIEDCIVNHGRRLGYKNSHDMLLSYKNFKQKKNVSKLAENELGILKK